jgi:hypothetical protein
MLSNSQNDSVSLDEDVVLSNEVKRLPPVVLRDIKLKNEARRLSNLKLIEIKIRKCIACDSLFESVGDRICGCNTGKRSGFIAGREII